MRKLSPLQSDLAIHAVCFVVQFILLFAIGAPKFGTTPPWMVPFYCILLSLTIMRIKERIPEYGTRLVMVPAILISLFIAIGLLIDMPRSFWAYIVPRYLSVSVRVVWMQLTFLLLHPDVFRHVCRWCSNAHEWLKSNGYYGWKIWVPALIVGMLLWLIRSQNISYDGYDWLLVTVLPKHWILYLREPLSLLILRGATFWGAKLFHWGPYCSITVVTIACGILTTILLSRVVSWLAPKPYAAMILVLAASCGGYTQIFAGNIEVYAILHLGLAFYLFTAMKYVRDGWPGWAPGIAFGMLFCIHLSAGWWLPAFLLLPWLKIVKNGAQQNSLFDAGIYYLASLAFVVAFFSFLAQHGYDGNFIQLFGHFFSDQVMYVGTDAAMFRPASDYFTWDYYMDMANEFFYLAPAAVILFVVLLVSIHRWGGFDPALAWISVIAFWYFIYTITWRPDRLFPMDWDLFSGLTIPAVLLIGGLVSRLKLNQTAVSYLLYQATVFSFIYLLLQLTRNHFKATSWPLYY